MTDTETPLLLFTFVMANVTITSAYIYLACTIAQRIKIHLLTTKIGGIGFFALCGLTHLHMAYIALAHSQMMFGEMFTTWYSLAIHVPQAICVWLFVSGLYIELGSWGHLKDSGASQ